MIGKETMIFKCPHCGEDIEIKTEKLKYKIEVACKEDNYDRDEGEWIYNGWYLKWIQNKLYANSIKEVRDILVQNKIKYACISKLIDKHYITVEFHIFSDNTYTMVFDKELKRRLIDEKRPEYHFEIFKDVELKYLNQKYYRIEEEQE